MMQETITLEQKIEAGLAEIRPFLQNDGGDIELINVLDTEEGKIVEVQLLGACTTCSINMLTLKSGVEMTVKRHAPEIARVVAIEPRPSI